VSQTYLNFPSGIRPGITGIDYAVERGAGVATVDAGIGIEQTGSGRCQAGADKHID
jgi:hypothetical protein